MNVIKQRNKTLGIVLLLPLLLAVLGTAALANTAPVARFNAYRSPESPSAVLFDASPSADSDGTIVSYQWLFGDGTTGSGVEKAHTYPLAGVFDVTLMVFDNGGASNLVTQAIDVAALRAYAPAPSTAPSQPAPAPGASAAVTVPANVPVGNEVGQRAPAFALPDFSDQIVELQDFLGRPVLVEFWKSTCPGCIASTPHLEMLREAYADDGLVVLLIILDQRAIEGYNVLMQSGYTDFVLVRESHPIYKKTLSAYGVSYTPRVFLIDRQGVIRYSGRPGNLTESTILPWL